MCLSRSGKFTISYSHTLHISNPNWNTQPPPSDLTVTADSLSLRSLPDLATSQPPPSTAESLSPRFCASFPPFSLHSRSKSSSFFSHSPSKPTAVAARRRCSPWLSKPPTTVAFFLAIAVAIEAANRRSRRRSSISLQIKAHPKKGLSQTLVSLRPFSLTKKGNKITLSPWIAFNPVCIEIMDISQPRYV
ncbi:hypothetical protein RIF29_18152 [Crotalaria pallida]|uniref:Uncharacterized protein n=1 Tax=Crotalaria pallida TaxID=3830 RepID=A0AAN9FQC4_CROPI